MNKIIKIKLLMIASTILRFLVTYSFKLQPTKDGQKQVMTMTRELQTAYFQNHQPEEMARLEAREQMELF